MPEPDENQARPRSPRFPSFDLQWAINAIVVIEKAEGRHPFDRETAAVHLGYKGINGNSARAVASLGYYNLLEKVGASSLKLTEAAREIALTPDMSQEKTDLIKKCFLQAKGFSEIIQHFGGLQELGSLSDITLRKELELKRDFSKEAAGDFISVFRSNLDFIKILPENNTARNLTNETSLPFFEEEDQFDNKSDKPKYIAQVPQKENTIQKESIAVNLSNGTRAEISILGKLDDRSATKLKSWLDKAVSPWIDFIKEDAEEDFDEM